jgi:flagellar M-ring protein FliF
MVPGSIVINDIWSNLGRSARVGLLAGVLAIVLGLVFALWSLRVEYQVLFSDLAPQDAGAMVAELDRLKIPYKLGDNGASILVDKDQVPQTRIKLMSKELPLHGTVGFELFNNTDFGMTEFAQKINYQRALQGEITRTILSLSEIQSARVHLALPEDGLFKNTTSVPKASIALTMKQGQALRAEQISGIQRLVSAAVPGISIADVTILDEHGVALTRLAHNDADGDGGSSRLELKEQTEKYLERKVAAVLERTFGAGQALASVDVTLDMDRIKTTTEDVLAPPVKNGQTPTGTIIRERENLHEGSAPLDSKSAASGGSSQHDVEYSVGRRIENVVATPGSIRHIDVVAVVRKPLDSIQLEKIRNIVTAAVGASVDRGDTIVVQTSDALGAYDLESALTIAGKQGGAPSRKGANGVPASRQASGEAGASMSIVLALSGLLLLIVGGALWWRSVKNNAVGAARLSDEQKQVLLTQLRAWMQETASDGPMPKGTP